LRLGASGGLARRVAEGIEVMVQGVMVFGLAPVRPRREMVCGAGNVARVWGQVGLVSGWIVQRVKKAQPHHGRTALERSETRTSST